MLSAHDFVPMTFVAGKVFFNSNQELTKFSQHKIGHDIYIWISPKGSFLFNYSSYCKDWNTVVKRTYCTVLQHHKVCKFVCCGLELQMLCVYQMSFLSSISSLIFHLINWHFHNKNNSLRYHKPKNVKHSKHMIQHFKFDTKNKHK